MNGKSISNLGLVFIILFLLWLWTKNDFRERKFDQKFISKITGLVLARCGSKGILMKNLVSIDGKTLLQRTISLMLNFGKFEEVWVSTDCKEIASEVTKAGAQVHWRDEATATDTSSSILAVQEFYIKHPGIKAIALVQCTSPFTKAAWLEEAYDKIINQGFESVFSVTRLHKLFWELQPDGSVKPGNFDVKKRPRRQDWTGQLVETGMFYFFHTSILEQNILQGGRVGFVEVPNNFSLEIDTEFDLYTARAISRILS